MDIAAVQILLLQGEQSLKRHTQAFLDLYHLVHYDNDSLFVIAWRQSSGMFMEYVDWVLLQNGNP